MEELKNNIRSDMAEISLETLVNVMENAKKELAFVRKVGKNIFHG